MLEQIQITRIMPRILLNHDAAGQLTDCIHFLCPAQRLFGLLVISDIGQYTFQTAGLVLFVVTDASLFPDPAHAATGVKSTVLST